MRTQVDGMQDEYSFRSGVDCGPSTVVRPEFAAETDTKFILRRYGPMAGTAIHGTQDMTMTLHQAFELQRSADASYHRLPESIRERFSSWREVLNALDSGELTRAEAKSVEVPEKPDAG